MTGKELIIHILQNNLENEDILGLMNEEEAAVKFGVGVCTIQLWSKYGLLKGIRIGNAMFFLNDTPDPRKESLKKYE